MTDHLFSAIHKAAIHRSAGGWNDPQRPFPIDGFTAFSGIVPGNVRNGSAGGFVNSAVNNGCHNGHVLKETVCLHVTTFFKPAVLSLPTLNLLGLRIMFFHY